MTPVSLKCDLYQHGSSLYKLLKPELDFNYLTRPIILIIFNKKNKMGPIENLYMALGEVVYAIAATDGKIQREEKEKLHGILKSEFDGHTLNFEPSEIMFSVLQKPITNSKTAYEWALKNIRLNSHYVSENLKHKFIAVVKKVAEAFPPITKDERALIDDFIYQLKSVKGDPIFSKETE